MPKHPTCDVCDGTEYPVSHVHCYGVEVAACDACRCVLVHFADYDIDSEGEKHPHRKETT